MILAGGLIPFGFRSFLGASDSEVETSVPSSFVRLCSSAFFTSSWLRLSLMSVVSLC